MCIEFGKARRHEATAPRRESGVSVVNVTLGTMDTAAISVRGIGKRYDMFERGLDRVKHWMGGERRAREFWALKDVKFDVMPGDAIGIVGRNGSGKSTLMQIIAGTLTPTTGEARIRGRISALLELGSGFNPAFTGRENVFLAGAILGFSRREMEKRFDEIAAFAEIGEFLDQPVEVYSSGMHARLAFSVAICVKPEILIVDEILSVGDAGFQQKCVSHMRRILESGVTLLFVSHSADMVKSICTKGLFLKNGEQMFFGPAAEAVDMYTQSLREITTERAVANLAARKPAHVLAGRAEGEEEKKPAWIERVRLLDDLGRESKAFRFGEHMTVEVTVAADADKALDRLDLRFMVRDRAGVDIFGSTMWDEGARMRRLEPGERGVARVTFQNVLRPGPHGVALTLSRRPNVSGDGLVTLDHQDVGAAFESLVGEKNQVRGKVHVPVRVEYAVRSDGVTE